MTIQSVEVIRRAATFKSTFRFRTTVRSTSPNLLVISLSDAGAAGEAWPMLAFISKGRGRRRPDRSLPRVRTWAIPSMNQRASPRPGRRAEIPQQQTESDITWTP